MSNTSLFLAACMFFGAALYSSVGHAGASFYIAVMALFSTRSPLAFIADHPWAYPALETVHVFGIALLVGNLLALELRVWGRAAQLPVMALARLSL